MLVHLNGNPQTPERVVVVGSRGFIGAALVSRLRKDGVPVLPVSSAEIDLTQNGSDEALAARLRPTDAAVMLSCRTPDKGRDLGTTMQNLAMGYHFAAAAAKAACRHVVYFSSDAVYGDDTQWVTDDTKAEPNSPYGAMHLTREVLLRSTMAGVLAVIRPTLVYGLADTHSSYGPNRFRRMREKDGKIALFGRGEERRDHIFIDDLIELTQRVLRRRSIGMLLGVTGRSPAFAEIAALVAEQASPPAEIVHLPRANPTAPILHRHFDITGLISAFPDMRFTSIEDGVALVHRQEREAAHG
jgi:nucleoside-diphosphate-sugar epimerase